MTPSELRIFGCSSLLKGGGNWGGPGFGLRGKSHGRWTAPAASPSTTARRWSTAGCGSTPAAPSTSRATSSSPATTVGSTPDAFVMNKQILERRKTTMPRSARGHCLIWDWC